MKYVFFVFGVVLLFSEMNAQETTDKFVRTNPIVVSANREPSLYSDIARIVTIIPHEEIINAPISTLDDLLEFAGSVDVRRRGGPSSQADYSIRGGSFDQTLILINGIAFNSSQTGHHNGNLPISTSDIERIEILEGSGARSLGNNAFSGGINIITKTSAENLISLSASGGQHSDFSLLASASLRTSEKFGSYISLSKDKNDGYKANTDSDNLNLFGTNSYNSPLGNFSLSYGGANRKFGANSFYTVDFPNQFEEILSGFAALDHTIRFAKFKITSKYNYNIHFDRFELFRDFRDETGTKAPSWYTSHNYHRTNSSGISTNISYISDKSKSSLGFAYKNEYIISNVLGKPLKNKIKVEGEDNVYYLFDDSRDDISIFAEQNLQIGRFVATAGVMFDWNSVFEFNSYAGIDLAYKVKDNITVFASANQAGRLPTFTDLYYSDPESKGNTDLKPEKSTSIEAGIKYSSNFVSSSVSVFRSIGKDVIDWVRQSDTTIWTAMNQSEIITNGMQIAVNLSPKAVIGERCIINFLNLSYTFVDNQKDDFEMMSKSSLDHLKHKFNMSLGLLTGFGLGLDLRASYQDRFGTYFSSKLRRETAYEEVSLISARLHFIFDKYYFFLDAENLLDRKYQDIGNLELPRLWIRGGVEIKFGF